jgi:cell division protein FtsX
MTDPADGLSAPRLLPGLALPSPGLSLAVAIIAVLASLDLGAASVLARSASQWSGRLTGSATIVTGGRDLESADAAVARAAEILGRTAGVANVKVLDPAPVDALAARLLGMPPQPASTPAPRVLAVRFKPGATITAARAADALSREGLVAACDDHGALSGPIERRGLLVAGAIAAAFVALLAVQAILIGQAIGATTRRLRERLLLLTQLGAAPSALARPLRDHAVVSAAVGAVLGSGAVMATTAVLAFEPGIAIRASARFPGLGPFGGFDVVVSAVWIPLALALAAGISRWAARRALRPLG